MAHIMNSPIRFKKVTFGYKSKNKIKGTAGLYVITMSTDQKTAQIKDSTGVTTIASVSGDGLLSTIRHLREALSNFGVTFPNLIIYSMPLTAATPTFSPVAGAYVGTQVVTISSTTGGASIYYTTNGATPTTSSTLYSGPVSVESSLTLKAIAVEDGLIDSAVGSAAYVIS